MNNQTVKKDPNNRGLQTSKKLFLSIWLGWQGSNLRMLEPKSSALPLGYTPSSTSVDVNTFRILYLCDYRRNCLSQIFVW